ncbi:hypothetical protein DSW25_12450 [Sulfitobacter donghicola DSW-25 = KCTC 12864 = JCM 14565]|uniref:Uncharacterized protein n=1 Tax=Sulfitobacter donghicola DSW-25 = KCTC 12864 = JCM 14565 TaxID=1300350 RepID=A0A073IHA8_9RHOB|nr:hypothetical protein DSW25_12450 [Sulfitobacter donghicola DSW-25 = KCTC 12864 = JCM 14565]
MRLVRIMLVRRRKNLANLGFGNARFQKQRMEQPQRIHPFVNIADLEPDIPEGPVLVSAA